MPAGNVKVDNSTGRSIGSGKTNPNVISWTATTITSTVAGLWSAADTGKSVTATGIPDYKTVTYVNPTTLTINGGGATPCTPSMVAPQVDCSITIGSSTMTSTTRQVMDAKTTAPNAVSSVAAKFVATDVGLPIVGANIPVGAVIATITGGGTGVTVLPATVTTNAVGHQAVIGAPSITAPLNGVAVADSATIIDLNPALVGGSNACSLNKPEGIDIQATWNNPGSFQTAATPGVAFAFALTPPATAKTIGQLMFRTSATEFGAYVVETPAAGDAAKAVAHYDVVFPSVPTGIGACPAAAGTPNITSSFHIVGVAQSQAILPTGTGKPSSAALRVLLPNGGVAASTSAQVKSDNATAPKNWTFTNTCTMAAAPASNFQCGY